MKKLILLLLLTFILWASCSVPATPVVSSELQQKLDTLVEQLEQQRQTLHVPGMAIAVVKDNEVILTHGFGVANVKQEMPVTPETIFAIGSSTKASPLLSSVCSSMKARWAGMTQ